MIDFIPTSFDFFISVLYFVLDASLGFMYQIFNRFDLNIWYLLPFIFGVTIAVKWILMPMMNGTGGGGIGTFVNSARADSARTRSDSSRSNNKKGGKKK